MPVASIIMPCYNAGLFVQESVNEILRQSFNDFELIIVDDASKDNSVDVLRELASRDVRIKLILHDKNSGASRSRNDGLRAAQGSYVGFCDADDLWNPEKLKLQIELLSANPDYDITYCDSRIIDAHGVATGELFSDQFPPAESPSGNLFEELCAKNFINMQTVLIRRGPVGDDILFDEGIKWVEDWWQWIRLSRKHRFLHDARVLAQYRVHQQSTGFTQKRGISRNRWKVCRRNLRMHTDMPPRLQALLWYYMGVELSSLGRRRSARKFFHRAVCLEWNRGGSFQGLMKLGARFVTECLSWS